MTKATVRAAMAADIGTATFELDPPDEAEMLRRFQELSRNGYPYFVAEVDGRIAGYAYVGPYRTRPAYRFTVENSIYITPDAQGKGVGRVLLNNLVESSTAKGYRLMVAVIGDSKNYGSIALHRGAGFTFCGVIHSVGYKFGRWLDSVIMELPLGEGDKAAPIEP